METFVIKLAVAVIPLFTLVAIATPADRVTRKRKALRFRVKRARVAARHAFAVAATHKWL